MTISMIAYIRHSADDVHMGTAKLWAGRSTCQRGHVGAVLVVDGRQVASGYNGAPPGHPHCTDIGCDIHPEVAGCQRSIHAEANAIAFAARHGVPIQGATLYCTAGPCLKCAQLILSAGIAEVIYDVPYRLPDGLNLLNANLPYPYAGKACQVRRYVRKPQSQPQVKDHDWRPDE